MRVENVIETSHWNLLISDVRPRHTSTASTLVCRGTQVGKHCSGQLLWF